MDLSIGMQQQKKAVDSGYWPLFRFDPRRAEKGAHPMQLDSKGPKIPFRDYAYNETRYKRLSKTNPEEAERLLKLAQSDVESRWKQLEGFANMKVGAES
jgi:pyruvate-ferredoxin/flavodoxin oxidoreductase